MTLGAAEPLPSSAFCEDLHNAPEFFLKPNCKVEFSSPILDERAFQKLYQQNQRKIFAVCFNIMKNHQDAEDACQETFIRAWQFRSEFRGESAFATWITRIAFNCCFNKLRIFENKPASTWTHLEEVSERYTACDDFKLYGFFLEKAKPRLGNKQRLVLSLMLDTGLSFTEVAGQLKVSRPAISKIVSGIRRKLANAGKKPLRQKKPPTFYQTDSGFHPGK